MKKLVSVISLFILIVMPFITMAHPGHGDHGDSGYTIIHYFTQPMHAVITLGSIVIVFVVLHFNRKKNTHTQK
jgi:hypothetical protein